MSASEAGPEVTLILQSIRAGDAASADRLLPLLYDELRRMARAKLRRTPGGTRAQTIQPTALVHEAYVRLVGKEGPAYENRKHFFFAAARAMQDILVEQARRKESLKRGGDRRREDLDDSDLAIEAPDDDVVGIAEALEALERSDPRKADVVRLRYFAGLTFEEVAAALDVSVPTVERDWRFARALLFDALKPEEENP